MKKKLLKLNNDLFTLAVFSNNDLKRNVNSSTLCKSKPRTKQSKKKPQKTHA